MASLAATAGQASAATLLDRSGNGTGNHWPSQDFAAPDDAYDSEIVDGFTIPKDEDWRLTAVRGIGVDGNTTRVRVTVYTPDLRPGSHPPGTVLFTREGTAAPPNYELALDNAPRFRGDFYWLSIQAVGGAQSGGWRWSQRSDTLGNPWFSNPGDGYGTGCTAFKQLGACWGVNGSMQYMLFGEEFDTTPSNELTLLPLKRNLRRGIGRLPVRVEHTGFVTVDGPRIKNDIAEVPLGGGTETLRIRPDAGAKRELERKGELRLAAAVKFQPTGGASATRHIQLRLKFEE